MKKVKMILNKLLRLLICCLTGCGCCAHFHLCFGKNRECVGIYGLLYIGVLSCHSDCSSAHAGKTNQTAQSECFEPQQTDSKGIVIRFRGSVSARLGIPWQCQHLSGHDRQFSVCAVPNCGRNPVCFRVVHLYGGLLYGAGWAARLSRFE